jgi:hypothetical protein
MQKLKSFRQGLIFISLLLTAFGASSFAQTFGGSNPITVSGTQFASVGSTANVSGLSGAVTAISVTFTNLNVQNLNSTALVLVAPTGQALDLVSGVCGTGTQQIGNSTFTLSDSNDTGTNNFSGLLPINGSGSTCPSAFAGTYKPSDYFPGIDVFHAPGPSTYKSGGIGTFNGNIVTGSDNFSTTFLSIPTASMNGLWTMYIAAQATPAPSGSLGSWTITFTVTAATQTTTTLGNGSVNPAFTSVNGTATPVTFQATVSPSPGAGNGTVTFFDGATAIATGVAINSAGLASATVSFAAEGNRTITAKYNGGTGFAASPLSNAVTETTINHASKTINGDGSISFCNGPIPILSNGGGVSIPRNSFSAERSQRRPASSRN